MLDFSQRYIKIYLWRMIGYINITFSKLEILLAIQMLRQKPIFTSKSSISVKKAFLFNHDRNCYWHSHLKRLYSDFLHQPLISCCHKNTLPRMDCVSIGCQ